MRFNPIIASALGLAACAAVGTGCAGTFYGGAGFSETPYYEDGHYGPGPFHDQSYYEDLYGSHGVYDGFVVPGDRYQPVDRADRANQASPGPVHDPGRGND
jgi:hypothetical protein